MNLKEKCKNKGFWISLVAAVVMVLQVCGLKIDAPVVNEIVSAVMGVLVVLGIVSDADRGRGYFDPDPSKPDPDSDDRA